MTRSRQLCKEFGLEEPPLEALRIAPQNELPPNPRSRHRDESLTGLGPSAINSLGAIDTWVLPVPIGPASTTNVLSLLEVLGGGELAELRLGWTFERFSSPPGRTS